MPVVLAKRNNASSPSAPSVSPPPSFRPAVTVQNPTTNPHLSSSGASGQQTASPPPIMQQTSAPTPTTPSPVAATPMPSVGTTITSIHVLNWFGSVSFICNEPFTSTADPIEVTCANNAAIGLTSGPACSSSGTSTLFCTPSTGFQLYFTCTGTSGNGPGYATASIPSLKVSCASLGIITVSAGSGMQGMQMFRECNSSWFMIETSCLQGTFNSTENFCFSSFTYNDCLSCSFTLDPVMVTDEATACP